MTVQVKNKNEMLSCLNISKLTTYGDISYRFLKDGLIEFIRPITRVISLSPTRLFSPNRSFSNRLLNRFKMIGMESISNRFQNVVLRMIL